MASLAELIRFREDLLNTRYSGVRKVRDQNGEEIEYKSDSELARALSSVSAEIAAVQSRPASTIHFKTSKGI
jgi:hypothetical protein